MYNKDLSLNKKRFKIASTWYEIIKTDTGSKGVGNAIDEVRNENTERTRIYKRSELIAMLKKFNVNNL